MSKLEKILAHLDPRVKALLVSIKHDQARESFPLDRYTVEDVRDFRRVAGEFYQWVWKLTMGGSEVPIDHAASMAWSVLERMYAQKGGAEAAYRAAKTGIDGGLTGVLNAIHMHLKREQEEHYVTTVLHSVIDPLSFDDRVGLMREYVERYAQGLPPSIAPKSAEELAANWEDLIKVHVKELESLLGRIGRA